MNSTKLFTYLTQGLAVFTIPLVLLAPFVLLDDYPWFMDVFYVAIVVFAIVIVTLATQAREPDFIIGTAESPYLRRWWVIPRNRFFNIYLHNMLRDDDDRALHDHPWASMSLVLKGALIETRDVPMSKNWRKMEKRVLAKGHIVFRRATDAHRLELVEGLISGSKLPAWTLFFTGPRVREWGFHCPNGWVHWRQFTNPENHGEIGPGCGD